MTPNSNKRFKLLINPEFQWKVILHFAALGLVIISTFFIANRYFFLKFMKKGELMQIPPNHVFFQFLSEQKMAMDWIYLTVTLSVMIFSFGYGLYFSHRVSGPLLRLKGEIRDWASGKRTQGTFKFRPKDYFQDLAKATDDYLKSSRADSIDSSPTNPDASKTS